MPRRRLTWLGTLDYGSRVDIGFIVQCLVLIGALAMGARVGGVGLGLWGAVERLVLVAGFVVAPAAIPGEVLLIGSNFSQMIPQTTPAVRAP
ncbi:MAG: anaerobic C4-dicarboxylate transporter family protein [Verrucomicrobiales bacterium]